RRTRRSRGRRQPIGRDPPRRTPPGRHGEPSSRRCGDRDLVPSEPAERRGRSAGHGERDRDDRGRAVVAQAELWLMETPNQKRRPVLIVSRDEAIPVLNNVVVAPVTSTLRDIPTCVPLGSAEGIDRDSVATFDNL